MALTAIGSWNPLQRIQRKQYWNITRCAVEEVKELDLGILKRGIRHVVDEREANPFRSLVDRSRAGIDFFRPKARNPPLNDQWHLIPLRRFTSNWLLHSELQPTPFHGSLTWRKRE